MNRADSGKKWIMLMIIVVILMGGALVVLGVYRGRQGQNHAESGSGATATTASGQGLGELGNDQDYGEAYQQKLTADVEKRFADMKKEYAQQNQESQEATKKLLDAYQQQLQAQQAMLQEMAAQRTTAQQAGAGAAPASPDLGEPISVSGVHRKTETTGLFTGTPQDVIGAEQTGVSEATAVPVPASLSKPKRRSKPNIAPMGFVHGTLLNGMVAKVGSHQDFTLISLTGPYQSANGESTNLQGCTITGQGTANLSSGRIDIKPIKLTCNLPGGRTEKWDVGGWVVDADGIQGVKGVIVDPTGKKMAGSALLGALSASARVINQNQYTSTYSGSSGSGSSLFTGNAGTAMASGALAGGATEAQNQLNEYNKLFAPSIQVGGGRDVTVVLATEETLPHEGSGLTRTYTVSH